MFDRRTLLGSGGAFALTACASASEITTPAQWRQLATEPYPRKQDDIFFVSRRIGWYGNGAGRLFRTRDGGEVWDKVWDHPGTFIRALGFMDDLNGLLGNVGVGYAPGVADPIPLYRTRDAGATWAPVEAEGIGAVGGICGIDILPQHSIFQGELRSTLVIHAAGRVGGPAVVLRSVDGGESWRVIDLSAHAGMILDVKFLDANTGFLCTGTSSNLDQSNAAILRTLDGGATWARVYQSTRPLELCWKMSFPSPRIGYATVQNNAADVTAQVVVKTSDGGATWRELPLVDALGLREFGVGFLTERRGWVGASSTGFQTNDGGRTWAPVEIGRPVNKIRIVREGRAYSVFAIGANVTRLDGELR